ncbi:MAG: Regulator of chromosome condensation (RCC1) repeat protein [Methanocella sp. PtaU1.Bin125]|nr:MAG: Regulator of chromosome condensation (RCC1) repeat protein [Methanocella sp. PtaU1.Bin125]
MSELIKKAVRVLLLAVISYTLICCILVSCTLMVYADSTATTPGIKSIKTGTFSLMLKNDGTVWAWGYNNLGMLGDGTADNANRPVKVSIDDMKEISAGNYFAMALKNDGTVWVWGSNFNGEHGDGTTYPPTEKSYQFLSIPSLPRQVPDLNDVKKIAAGDSCFAIKNDGTIWAWGKNTLGELGDGTLTARSIPVQVTGLVNIISISNSAAHTLALDNNGKVWAWGSNAHGELGNNSADKVNDRGYKYAATPVSVPIDNVVAIATGQGFSLAIKNDGTVWAWGDNEFGELGDGTRTSRADPSPIPGLNNVVKIEASRLVSMALKSDGTLWLWGLDANGLANQMAFDGATYTNTLDTPKQIKLIDGVKEFALGGDDVLAMKNDGTLWAWGNNWYGQLGIGTFSNENIKKAKVMTPIKVLVDSNTIIEPGQDSNPPYETEIPTATPVNSTDQSPQAVGTPTPITHADPNLNGTDGQTSHGNPFDIKLICFIGLAGIAIVAIYLWYRRYK